MSARLISGGQTVGHVLERDGQGVQLGTETAVGHLYVVVAVRHALRRCGEVGDGPADAPREKPRQRDRRDDRHHRCGHQRQSHRGPEGLLSMLLHLRRVLAGHAQMVQEQPRGDEDDRRQQGQEGHEHNRQLRGEQMRRQAPWTLHDAIP